MMVQGGVTPLYAVTKATNAPVMAICYAQGWAANENYMTFAEAAAVTDIGAAFKGKNIVTFNEFQYFTSVTSIGGTTSNGFFKTTSLREITLPTSITTIGSYCFQSTNISSIELHEGITTLGGQCIYQTKITSITIPSTVTSWTVSAFNKNYSLVDVTINCNVNNINAMYFESCPVTTLQIGAGATRYAVYDNCLYGNDYKKLFYVPQGKTTIDFHQSLVTIGESACRNTRINSDIILPSSVTTINNYAFQSSYFTGITLPSGVKTLPNQCFMDCTRLTKVNVDYITAVNGSCLRNIRVTTLDFKANVSSFDIYGVFFNTSTLSTLIVRKASVVPLSNSALTRTAIANGNGYIYVPDNLVNNYKAASNWITYANYIKPISELPS